MTFVGKILVVVNVALTICIAMFAAGVHAVQTSWKTKAEKADEQLKAAQTANRQQEDKLKADVAKLRASLKEEEEAKADVSSKLTELQRRLPPLEASAAARDNAINIQEQRYNIAENQRKSLQKEKDALEAALKTARGDNDDHVKRIAKLQDDIHELQRQERELKRNHMKLVREYVAARKLLSANDIEWDPEKALLLASKPKPAQGLVVGVLPGGRDKATLVEVSIGKDDGVALGQRLLVYRLAQKGKYLGKVEIVYVTADRAVGTLVDDPKNGEIKKGDNVSAKL